MTDRRSMRRFDLKLPCFICPLGQQGQERTTWLTRNISAGGAYINATLTVPLGTRVSIQIIVMRSSQTATNGNGACVTLCGEIVRKDDLGIAVEFDDQYSIGQIGKWPANDETLAAYGSVVKIGQKM